MIFGAFDEDGRPYIRGQLAIPRLGVKGYVTFLVDTGADSTCIHPEDARRVGIPFERLFDAGVSTGIGGNSVYFREPAVMSFTDEKIKRLYAVELLIGEPSDSSNRLPSLLGRNLLNRWRVEYDPTDLSLECIVRSADRTVD